MSLSKEIIDQIRVYAHEFAAALHVNGLMNMQLAVKDNKIYMIEVNPRASRTIPFVSKAIGVHLAGLAALCMTGRKLADLGFTHEVVLPYTAVKEAVFPFVKFPGVDIVLTPEMKSTGEVMSLDTDWGIAYLKSQLAAGSRLPKQGSVFLSVKDQDKPRIVEIARKLVELGFKLYATLGTSTLLCNEGIRVNAIFRISKGRPNLLDLIREGEVQWVINTSENGAEAMVDEIRMRSKSIAAGIPITTTIAGAEAAVDGLRDQLEFGRFEVSCLQEYHRHIHQAAGQGA
jgi:carbamoyl-phosphate synthase large subunit